MATQLQLRKGTTAEHSTFVGADGEVTVDTTKKALVLHDGVTAGGKPLPTLEGDKIPLNQLSSATTSSAGIVRLNNTITSASASDALTAAQGKILGDRDFGIGQTWQNVTSSRAANTTYTNTTNRPIMVSIYANSPNITYTIKVGGVVANQSMMESQWYNPRTLQAIVPPGASYIFNAAFEYWAELR